MIPKVSVIVINWNGLDLTRNCLKFLRRNAYYGNVEFIVVDNGSTDGSYEKLKREFPFARHIRLPINKGYSHGANKGIVSSKGEYVLIMNNDIQVTKGWVSPLIEVMENDKTIVSATPKILSFGKKYKIPKKTTCKVVDAPSGAATCYRKEALNEIGLLDEKNFYPIYGEENDWSYRASNAGYKTVEVQNSVIYHKGSVTTRREYATNELYIVLETHRIKAMLFNLPFYKLVRFMPGLSLIFLRGIFSGNILQLLKVYWSVLSDFDEIMKTRKSKLSKIRKY